MPSKEQFELLLDEEPLIPPEEDDEEKVIKTLATGNRRIEPDNNNKHKHNKCFYSTVFALMALVLTFLFILTVQTTQSASKKPSVINDNLPPDVETNQTEELLIDTKVCRLKPIPLIDDEIKEIYGSQYKKSFKCRGGKEYHKVTIRRVDSTKLQIDELKDSDDWSCKANQILLVNSNSYKIDSSNSIPMKHVTDFTDRKWDSVLVKCTSKNGYSYEEAMLLIQDHINREKSKTGSTPKYNIMLFGLDSISRMNSERHLKLCNALYKREGFVELTGYHKVGENTYPNVVPILIGKPDWKVYNDSWKDFKWDNVTTLFKQFHQAGYTTTFIEDMPPYGLFTRRGGFVKQPTDYCVLEAQEYIWKKLTDGNLCYKNEIEHKKYWNYFVDLLHRYKKEEDVKHFSYVHMSTLTHDWFNYAGFADLPYSQMFESIFASGHQKDTVIVSFSDHAIRFGSSVDTDANVHEAKLPYIHIYIPDSLELDGKNATELREILYNNRKRLTSHYDLHATFLHILHGTPPTGEEFGISLFTPIPEERRCSDAGVQPQYCMCNSYEKLSLSKEVQKQTAQFAIDNINNNLLSEVRDMCVDLTLTGVKRVFESVDHQTSKRRWLIVFTTAPNKGMFEAIIDLDDRSTQSAPIFLKVINTSRLSLYGNQADCLGKQFISKAEPFCYCKNLLKHG